MGEVTTIGLDLAKHVFQVHGVDAEGATVLRKQLRRAQVLAFFSGLPPCLVGLEACATAHYWARELRPLLNLCQRRFLKMFVQSIDERCALGIFGNCRPSRLRGGAPGADR